VSNPSIVLRRQLCFRDITFAETGLSYKVHLAASGSDGSASSRRKSALQFAVLHLCL